MLWAYIIQCDECGKVVDAQKDTNIYITEERDLCPECHYKENKPIQATLGSMTKYMGRKMRVVYCLTAEDIEQAIKYANKHGQYEPLSSAEHDVMENVIEALNGYDFVTPDDVRHEIDKAYGRT